LQREKKLKVPISDSSKRRLSARKPFLLRLGKRERESYLVGRRRVTNCSKEGGTGRQVALDAETTARTDY